MKIEKLKFLLIFLMMSSMSFTACKDDDDDMQPMAEQPVDPDTAPKVSVDRFSDEAATLMMRSANPNLPAANSPINYDMPPFITKGLGPNGQMVEYYNFDVQPTDPAPIFVLFRQGESMPVDGQLNIIDVVPGDGGYNDFWHVHKVTVPADYTANVVTSRQEIIDKGYTIEATTTLVNCPVVSEGSIASKRMGGGTSGLIRGWYKDQVVLYFSFEEKNLMTTGSNMVPISPIYVTFNKNPDMNDPTSGPPSGFVTEMWSAQTHNVVATIPSDAGYSPLWSVSVYDNMDFDNVMDLSSAQNANVLAMGVANVNCPIVSVQ
ncbi:MAG: hypothetical protein WD077_04770 [Bacteroidia bacterium]